MDFARQIKDQVSIERVMQDHGIRLRKAGGYTFKALCPFHQEKTPSFNVRPDRGYFHCFGCQKSGTVIDFVMEIEGLTFWEACKQLAEQYGIPLPKRAQESDERTRKRAGIYEANDIAQALFRSQLVSPAGQQAREYLKSRGVPPQLAEEFGLGYIDRSGQTLLRRLQQAGLGPDQLEQTGLVLKREGGGFYDRFRGRLMFPIHSESGKVIAFAGRALAADDQPKYLNSPETELYHKTHVLYNLHRARKAIHQQHHAILVEGYMDVIGLWGGGVGETIASCGTALTDTQVRILARYTDSVFVNFDPDTAGAAATERSLQMLLEMSLKIRVLSLPDGLDPDEFVQKHGADAYRALLEKAPRYFHWLADRVRGRFDMRSAEGRIEAVKYLLPSVQRLANRYERAAVAEELASHLRIDKSFLFEQLRLSGESGRREARPAARGPVVPPVEKLLLRCLVHSEDARREVLPRLEEAMFAAPLVTQGILRALAALGAGFDLDQLRGRLTEAENGLLAAALFADEATIEQLDTQLGATQALACLDKLDAFGRDSRRNALKERIRAAEQSGDLGEALRLTQELAKLGRK